MSEEKFLNYLRESAKNFKNAGKEEAYLATLALIADFPSTEKTKDCPHASPFRYCQKCVETPCPVGLPQPKTNQIDEG